MEGETIPDQTHWSEEISQNVDYVLSIRRSIISAEAGVSGCQINGEKNSD